MALPARRMILHPLAPHSLNATSSARDWVSWFQIQPRFPVSLSQAMAPYGPTAEEVPGGAGKLCAAPTPSPITRTCRALSIAHEGSFERKPGPRGQRRWRAAGLYPAVLLVGNVVISAVKPKVHAHCPLPLHIA